MEKRVHIQTKVSPVGAKKLDDTAKKYNLTRSDVMRACFIIALPTRELHERLQAMSKNRKDDEL